MNAAAVPLMLTGLILYRQAGSYRHARAGGRGMRTMPTVLVTTGPYAVTRNPMYAGHLLFTAGLALATCSPLAAVLLVERWIRLQRRVGVDERRLAERFGREFDAYRATVPRWLPRLPFGSP